MRHWKRNRSLHAVKIKSELRIWQNSPSFHSLLLFLTSYLLAWCSAPPCSPTAHAFCPPFALDKNTNWKLTLQRGTEEISSPPWKRIHKKGFFFSGTTTNPMELSPTQSQNHQCKCLLLGLRSHLNKDSPRVIVFV